MKRFVLAIALTGLMSMAVLAGEVPTNGAPAPAPTTSSTLLTNVVVVIITVIGR